MESIPKVAEYWLSKAHYMEIALNPYDVPDRNIHTHTPTSTPWCLRDVQADDILPEFLSVNEWVKLV